MKHYFIFQVVAVLFLLSCSKDDITDPTIIKKESLSGVVQKGPFISGTGISIHELTGDLSQTGKNYTTQITDNKGSFQINNIELISNYISLRVDGFYYNEVLGKQSKAQITLFALSDISDKSSVNVNILAHLEKPRVEYLVSQGISFEEAKAQAQSEVLEIFNIDTAPSVSSELLDISMEGDGHAKLLAASVILQGYRNEAELTELLSEIGSDLGEDGTLDNAGLGSRLVNHAVFLDKEQIKSNLTNRYSQLGVTVNIPQFENHLSHFIEATDFEVTGSVIDYPETGIYGENILDPDKTAYTGKIFSLSANLIEGTRLKIIIIALSDTHWYYNGGTEYNWSINNFDFETRTQVFTAIESGKSCDLRMIFDPGEYRIEYYEMESEEPTRTKAITCSP